LPKASAFPSSFTLLLLRQLAKMQSTAEADVCDLRSSS
jgi:hypothetical protein